MRHLKPRCTVKCLRDYCLLSNVREIVSVSGGSILSAHLAMNWEDYNSIGNESRFYRAANRLIEFGKFDLRGHIVRRCLLGVIPRYRRTVLLEKYYSQLLNGGELRELSGRKPNFSILTTSMTTGRLCYFNAEGYHDGITQHVNPGIPLSFAVASSSAFPPLFPPAKLTRKTLNPKRAEAFPYDVEHLTDGGVYDNIGLSELNELSSVRLQYAGKLVAIISDASAPFDWQTQPSFHGIIARTIRTTDILMTRVARLEEERWRMAEIRSLVIRSDEIVKRGEITLFPGLETSLPQDEGIQALVYQVRTDLDEFNMYEITALIRHGYEVALKAIQSGLPSLGPTELFLPSDPCVCDEPGVCWIRDDAIGYVSDYRRIRSKCSLGLDLSIRINEALRRHKASMQHLDFDEIKNRLDETGESLDELRTKRRLAISEQERKLRTSRCRRWGIWNSNDLASWLLLLFGMVLIIVIFHFFLS